MHSTPHTHHRWLNKRRLGDWAIDSFKPFKLLGPDGIIPAQLQKSAESQALALTRAANAAAAAAAASANAAAQGIKPSSAASLAELALKKEHSLSPPQSVGSSCGATGGGGGGGGTLAGNVDEGGGGIAGGGGAANYRRRPSLQGHQQQLREQLAAHDEARSPRFGVMPVGLGAISGASGIGIGRSRSTDATSSPNATSHLSTDNERHISSTPSSQNVSLAATPKLLERDERGAAGSGGSGGVGLSGSGAVPALVGSISCLPPAALNAVASSMASGVPMHSGVGVGGVTTQAEQLLAAPSAIESRAREFDSAAKSLVGCERAEEGEEASTPNWTTKQQQLSNLTIQLCALVNSMTSLMQRYKLSGSSSSSITTQTRTRQRRALTQIYFGLHICSIVIGAHPQRLNDTRA
ncbi:putative lysozyme-like protein [Anastrepha obliqua]|uniref:putative lysozyme-like protein n=1 Tax=Anastrepha obliqua TaxID=95512 RepID=UPI00240A3536|nr:putative lysozyme-like protein [Anastrepha obliqua]